MSMAIASRTLVKSPPELWSEVSNAASLQRHLDRFGEIRITRLEPETAVAWEGEDARGTVTLEPAGWGTRVNLTAEPLGASEERCSTAPLEISPRVELSSAVAAEIRELSAFVEQTKLAARSRPARPRRLARAFLRWLMGESRAPISTPAPGSTLEPSAASSAQAQEPPQRPEPARAELLGAETAGALADALDSLGQAHHRPFSRA